jgi:Flp pilus assembly protein TadG
MVSKLGNFVQRMREPTLLRRWRRDQSGVTSIEFGVVALPFMMLLFGILSVSLYYFIDFTIQNAAWQASRGIRTGQLQQGQGSYAGVVTTEDRKKAFKKALCDRVPAFLDCNSKAVVIVQSNANFGGIVKPACSTNGVIVNGATAAFDPGGSSSVVLITVCYPWTAGGKLPFFKMGNLSDGSLLMQTSVALRTEPYK